MANPSSKKVKGYRFFRQIVKGTVIVSPGLRSPSLNWPGEAEWRRVITPEANDSFDRFEIRATFFLAKQCRISLRIVGAMRPGVSAAANGFRRIKKGA